MPTLTRTILSVSQLDDEEETLIAGLLTSMLPAVLSATTVAGLPLLLTALLLATTKPLRVARVVLFAETE
ncbi:MAG: hypothetical protein ACE5HA_04800 [Anaerolineae bacterium]